MSNVNKIQKEGDLEMGVDFLSRLKDFYRTHANPDGSFSIIKARSKLQGSEEVISLEEFEAFLGLY
jgi:hypothetical protein